MKLDAICWASIVSSISFYNKFHLFHLELSLWNEQTWSTLMLLTTAFAVTEPLSKHWWCVCVYDAPYQSVSQSVTGVSVHYYLSYQPATCPPQSKSHQQHRINRPDAVLNRHLIALQKPRQYCSTNGRYYQRQWIEEACVTYLYLFCCLESGRKRNGCANVLEL